MACHRIPFCKVGTNDNLPDIIDSLERLFRPNQYQLLLQYFTRVGYLVVVLKFNTCQDRTSSKFSGVIEVKVKQGGSERLVYSINHAGKYALLLVL